MNINLKVLLTGAFIITASTVLFPQPDNNGIFPNGDESVIMPSNDIFDLIMPEAKAYYADALVASFYNDSIEVKNCFDHVFEIMAEIGDLDSLSLPQQDEFKRFNEKVTNDYQTNFTYLIDELDTSSITAIEQEFFESILDTIDIGNDALIVVEDQPGHMAIVRSKKIDSLIRYFSGRPSKTIQRFLELSSKYRAHMVPILQQYGVPEELMYLPMIESGYNANANSVARAVGIWQFIAGTGAIYGLKRNQWIDERRDPIKSTHAAAKYLRKLYDEFDDWYLALAAYNCGENRVWRTIKREGTRDYWKLKTLPPATRGYVPSFMAVLLIAKNPEKYGFTSPTTPTWEWDEVLVDHSYGLDDIAKVCNLTPEILRDYNPELRRKMTPTNDKEYCLRVPKGLGDSLKVKLVTLPEPKDVEVTEIVYHKVKKGQTLSSIAYKYGTSVSALVSANHLRNSNQLRVGQTLLIPTSAYYSAPEKKTAETEIITHIVKSGETLSGIANTYHTSLSKIRSMNNLYQDNIQPGMELKIAAKSSSAHLSSPNRTKIVHVVKKGDTLSSIANRYHVSLVKLKSWNSINSRKPIYPGQRIIIYKS